jgi:hypothetical protein
MNFPIIPAIPEDNAENTEDEKKISTKKQHILIENGPFKATGRDAHWQKYVGAETSNGSMLRPNYKYVQSHPKTSYVMRYGL